MARTCTICTHPQRQAIDEALVAGRAYRLVATTTGGEVTEASLRRHHASHVSPALVQVAAEQDRRRGRSLLERVEDLVDEAEDLLVQAKATGSVSQGATAIREMRAAIELLGKATGELRGDTTQINVLNVQESTEWAVIRGQVMGALAPYPEARLAVKAVLMGEVASALPAGDVVDAELVADEEAA